MRRDHLLLLRSISSIAAAAAVNRFAKKAASIGNVVVGRWTRNEILRRPNYFFMDMDVDSYNITSRQKLIVIVS